VTKAEERRLREVAGALEAVHAGLNEMVSGRQESWTLDDLRQELDRWKQELVNTTGTEGQPYSADTIRSHIGHSAQFIRWLAGEWQPHGPRSRA
jgi:hypothetical protein